MNNKGNNALQLLIFLVVFVISFFMGMIILHHKAIITMPDGKQFLKINNRCYWIEEWKK